MPINHSTTRDMQRLKSMFAESQITAKAPSMEVRAPRLSAVGFFVVAVSFLISLLLQEVMRRERQKATRETQNDEAQQVHTWRKKAPHSISNMGEGTSKLIERMENMSKAQDREFEKVVRNLLARVRYCGQGFGMDLTHLFCRNFHCSKLSKISTSMTSVPNLWK